MPAKRRAAPAAASSSATPKEKKARPSKLAKENGITAEEEAEIREAFQLFSQENEDFEDEAQGVIPIPDVRRALIALGLPATSTQELNNIISSLDPTNTSYTTYTAFVSVCALKLQSRTESAISAEIEAAFKLFTRGSDGPITVGHLRRVARELKEDVSDELLRDMIREANGGEAVQRGVELEEFRDVMGRAGMF